MLDHSSDPNFLEYFQRESMSEGTIRRFSRVRDNAIRLWSARNGRSDALDVVDVGCGAGTQALLWAEQGHRVQALDVNEPLLQIARERSQQRGLMVRFELGTAAALPFATASTDICLLPELLEHVADWEACVREADRVLRPGGVLYLSTTNRLCPFQAEFSLPLYAWYPRLMKRYCERLAVTTRPEIANYARYPAVHWFSYFQLKEYLTQLGFDCLDRFDMIAQRSLSTMDRALVTMVRWNDATRLVAHVCTSGTTVWALKGPAGPTPANH